MRTNVGSIDRPIRMLIGAFFINLVYMGPQTTLGLLGFIPLMSGLLGYCPIYHLFGLNTCRVFGIDTCLLRRSR